ncbi:MAG: nucleotidyl transferase AbiEii/AbiGii toxin family protein [Bacteroidales bacterium]|nr:nucleotidyl transferase AbiEii/AbiGii toxin family protein [Bacteroidales bacterium]
MITKNPMQLKAFIKKKAAEKNISAQLVMQNYMLERLLERISMSRFRHNFILKGGFLISAIVGLDTRATMDIDTTIKGFTLTHESIHAIFEEVCAVEVADDVKFEVADISDIREGDDYPGIRVSLKANYPPISVPLTVDVTTGDAITPREIDFTFSLLFDDRSISILAYNLETILAEKIETVLSRNIANTRPRDFYDIHVLYTLRGAECNSNMLLQALERTTAKRGSTRVLQIYPDIMKEIRTNKQLQGFWEKYQHDFDYAKGISFDDACDTILLVMDNIIKKAPRR